MKFLKYLAVVVLIFVGIIISLLAPIDRTPIEQQPFYETMLQKIDSLEPVSTTGKFWAGWQKVNITPKQNMPMAGYKARDHFESVHDSLFASIMVISNQHQKVVLVNLDLLIFPPSIKTEILNLQKKSLNTNTWYFSSTHTHNGIGGWDETLGGQYALGDYNEDWVMDIAKEIFQTANDLEIERGSIKYWEADASDLVENRISNKDGLTDGTMRGFIIERVDSTKACLFSYSAHATSIRKSLLSITADYPSIVIQNLKSKFDFSMFMSGMVGSHKFEYMDVDNFELMEREGNLLTERINKRKEFLSADSLLISSNRIPIEFGPAQLRLSKNWKLRNWAFQSLFKPLTGEFNYLRFGDIVMIGTPCDFSGEIFVRDSLESIAKRNNKHLIVTSFNGDYVGYITYDGHYDSQQSSELYEMNWTGPGYGKYFSDMVTRLLEK